MADGSGKIDNQAAGGLASRACMQLALSIGIVLDSILVYSAPTQHFGALIALVQPGGAKVDIAGIRMLQEKPQSRPRKSTDAMMRGIIVDWLVKVHIRYGLRSETLYLAVNIIDRFMAQRDVQWSCLQLVAAAAIVIARKLDEAAQREARHARITDDILQMERRLLAIARGQLIIAASSDLARRQKYERTAKKNAYPPPPRPHGGKHLRRAGTLAQPGGRQRGKDRWAPRKQ